MNYVSVKPLKISGVPRFIMLLYQLGTLLHVPISRIVLSGMVWSEDAIWGAITVMWDIAGLIPLP